MILKWISFWELAFRKSKTHQLLRPLEKNWLDNPFSRFMAAHNVFKLPSRFSQWRWGWFLWSKLSGVFRFHHYSNHLNEVVYDFWDALASLLRYVWISWIKLHRTIWNPVCFSVSRTIFRFFFCLKCGEPSEYLFHHCGIPDLSVGLQLFLFALRLTTATTEREKANFQPGAGIEPASLGELPVSITTEPLVLARWRDAIFD